MDPEPSCPKPLHVRKIAGQHKRGPSHNLPESEQTFHPPRTSSLSEPAFVNAFSLEPAGSKKRSPLNSKNFHDNSTSPPRAFTTDRVPSNKHKKGHSVAQSSFSIMGNFVPIEKADLPRVATSSDRGELPFSAPYSPRRTFQNRNPYEFEPASPFQSEALLASVSSQNGLPYRPSHVKNSRSEDNSIYNSPQIVEYGTSNLRPIGRAIHRSESSPNLSPLPFLPRRDKTPSTELASQPSGHQQTGYSIRHGPHHAGYLVQNGPHHTGQQVHRSYVDAEGQYSSTRPDSQDRSQGSRSPSRLQHEEPSMPSYTPHRSLTRSPTKTLDDVSERDEQDSIAIQYASTPPKKRSRSPMKKMFGDHGWLGQSPDEKPDQSSRSRKKASAARNDPSSPHYQKKTTMMSKLKNKLEEFAEKAELTPTRSSRGDREKHPKLSVLSVSLGPPEQARVYMEIELMLVHTANCFLMAQFSQGRIAVDSIKKTVDLWKSKGRPIVIEFMYDQATQRELVAANQHNFRFHGGRVGDEIRINSMLYNWKQVANLMAIRTFCTADTVLLKLLFDIEQILELLGAGEPMLLRLQQIRASANEMMRIARHAKDAKSTAQAIPRGREMVYDAHSSVGSGSQGDSMMDTYGGLKLVPDTYKE